MMAFQVNINTKKNVNVKSIFLFMKTTRDGWVGMRYMIVFTTTKGNQTDEAMRANDHTQYNEV